MPRTTMVDTSFLVALLDPRDRLNAAARALSHSLASEDALLCTTDAVLIEDPLSNAHSPDESLHAGDFRKLTASVAHLFQQLGDLPDGKVK